MRGAWLPLFAMLAGACGDNLEGNRPPTATAFSLLTQEDLAVMRAVDANDLDGDALEVLLPLPPSHGEVAVNGFAITYTPDANFAGTEQFPITISDGIDEVTVTIDVVVEGVNDAPFAVDDAFTSPRNTPLVLAPAQLVANDTDPENDDLTVSAAGNLTTNTGTLAFDDASGTVTYTPKNGFTGVATFDYSVSDGMADDSGVATITVTQ